MSQSSKLMKVSNEYLNLDEFSPRGNTGPPVLQALFPDRLDMERKSVVRHEAYLSQLKIGEHISINILSCSGSSAQLSDGVLFW